MGLGTPRQQRFADNSYIDYLSIDGRERGYKKIVTVYLIVVEVTCCHDDNQNTAVIVHAEQPSTGQHRTKSESTTDSHGTQEYWHRPHQGHGPRDGRYAQKNGRTEACLDTARKSSPRSISADDIFGSS